MSKSILYYLGITALSVVSFISSSAANRTYIYDRWYNVDTLQCSKVGPGTEYSSIKFTSEDGVLTFRTFFLKSDVENPNLRFECELGGDSIIGGETVRHHAQTRTKSGKYYIAGTNGDFYTTGVPVGIPIHACVQGAQSATPPSENAPHFVIGDGHTPWISQINQSQFISINGGSAISLNRINNNRYTNELVLFNSLNGKYTHTSEGGKEIALTLAPGETWKINSPVKCIVTGSASTSGNMRIPDGQAVLSADGSSTTIIDGLKEGDEVVLNLGQSLTHYNAITPNVTGVMGGNVILVANGAVVPQGDMARHPRTMLGYTKDQKQVILCVLDGRSTTSSGGIYLELADVMRYAGADWAMNIDGGGSSTMYVQNLGIMNKPSDGTERAVSNGVYLVMDTPEDNEIASIQFKDWSMKFPKYGVYSPVFYGYNKYGMLVDSDLKGVELNCDPRLGRIENGSTFIGDGDGTYALNATYKGATASIPVTVEVSDDVAIRLSNIITDTFREYPVEVVATMNETQMPISASALDWTSDDASIVTIDANTGTLKGVKDGTTKIHGTVGDFSGSLDVTVEKPTAHVMPIDKDMDISTWKITSTGANNLVVTPLDNGMNINYVGTTGRNPNIKFVKSKKIWSLPDYLRIRINPGDATINSIKVAVVAGSNSAQIIEMATNVPKNQMNEYSYAIKDLCNSDDLANYPISLENISFTMGANTTGKEYTISMPGVEAVYDAIPAGVEKPSVTENQVTISPNPVHKGETVNITLPNNGKTNVSIHDLSGSLCYSKIYNLNFNKLQVSTTMLNPGTYLINIKQGDKLFTSKLVVK